MWILSEKAVQPIDEEGEEQDGENGAENNENGDENGGQATDGPGTSKEGDGNNEEAKKKGKGKSKEMRMELSSRSSELTSKIHKMAEEMGDRFGKGENATNPNEEELIRTLNEFTTDIGQNVTARRVGVGCGNLQQKSNHYIGNSLNLKFLWIFYRHNVAHKFPFRWKNFEFITFKNWQNLNFQPASYNIFGGKPLIYINK